MCEFKMRYEFFVCYNGLNIIKNIRLRYKNESKIVALEVFERKILRKMYVKEEEKRRADLAIWRAIHNWYGKSLKRIGIRIWKMRGWLSECCLEEEEEEECGP